MAALNASLQVDFTPGEEPPLLLEYGNWDDGGRSLDTIRLRLYPPVQATVVATAGTVTLAEQRTQQVIYEILKFTGETRARTRLPISSGFLYQSLAAAFDKTGKLVNPALTWDPATAEVVSDIAFYGGVQVQYNADYRVIHYTPLVETEPSAGGTGAVTVRIGTVMAVYHEQVVTKEIDLQFEEDQQNYVELYRIYSYLVLSKESDAGDSWKTGSSWEKPPDWPKQRTYPTSNSEGPDPDNSFTEERPHEIAYLNKDGHIQFNAFYVTWAQPYVGAVNYVPEYEMRKASLPDDYKEAGASVDWAVIAARRKLNTRFPGLKIG